MGIASKITCSELLMLLPVTVTAFPSVVPCIICTVFVACVVSTRHDADTFF